MAHMLKVMWWEEQVAWKERNFSPGPGGSKSSAMVYLCLWGPTLALHLLEETPCFPSVSAWYLLSGQGMLTHACSSAVSNDLWTLRVDYGVWRNPRFTWIPT